LSVKQFLASKNIALLAHPPYSPDLAPCDFFLFPKIKSVLKGTHFVSVEEVIAKMTKLLNSLPGTDLNHCFEQWQHHMQLCLNSEGDYFGGDHK
jgi:transposase